jgi:hypothetical protein
MVKSNVRLGEQSGYNSLGKVQPENMIQGTLNPESLLPYILMHLFHSHSPFKNSLPDFPANPHSHFPCY